MSPEIEGEYVEPVFHQCPGIADATVHVAAVLMTEYYGLVASAVLGRSYPHPAQADTVETSESHLFTVCLCNFPESDR